MEMEFSMGHRTELRQELTPEQRLEIKFDLQQQLLYAVRGDNYSPRATCPDCHHDLTIVEIMKGFRRDPQDYTTKCPKCKRRFKARLICISAASRVELAFYCPTQTTEALRPLVDLPPEELLQEHSAIYRSAIFHFGSLKKAFRSIKMRYRFAEMKDDWAEKVQGFLGLVPDTFIASVAGVSLRQVRDLRHNLDIDAFTGYHDEE